MLLVTGITGQTGKYFLNRLIDVKYRGKIKCVVRRNSNIELLKSCGLDFEIEVGDL